MKNIYEAERSLLLALERFIKDQNDDNRVKATQAAAAVDKCNDPYLQSRWRPRIELLLTTIIEMKKGRAATSFVAAHWKPLLDRWPPYPKDTPFFKAVETLQQFDRRYAH